MRLLPYYYLLKPRVITLVVFTGMVGLFLAPNPLPFLKGVLAILCIAGGSGAAGAFNMWYERDIDALMERTKSRPLPQGQVSPLAALAFSLTLALLSVGFMYGYVNPIAAFYLALAIIFYGGIYTIWLKRRTPQNIVIGGAAGALPPVIGWACTMGETTWVPWALCGIIFLWTPPHFWALSLYYHDDYAKANIPMLPLTAGSESTKTHILGYTGALVSLTLILGLYGNLGVFYTVTAILLGFLFISLAVRVKRSSSPKEGLHLFLFSIIYLFLLFAAMLIKL